MISLAVIISVNEIKDDTIAFTCLSAIIRSVCFSFLEKYITSILTKLIKPTYFAKRLILSSNVLQLPCDMD